MIDNEISVIVGDDDARSCVLLLGRCNRLPDRATRIVVVTVTVIVILMVREKAMVMLIQWHRVTTFNT